MSLRSVTASTQGLYAMLGPMPSLRFDGGLTFGVPEPAATALLGAALAAGLARRALRTRRS